MKHAKALLIVLALMLIGSTQAEAITCQATKGPGYGWSWRQIDGKKCWYKGPARIAKSKLAWVRTVATKSKPLKRTMPLPAPATSDADLLMSYWPDLPRADNFEDRWNAAFLILPRGGP